MSTSSITRLQEVRWYAIWTLSRHEKLVRDQLAVLKAPGVVRVIGGCGRPEPIPDHEIEAIQKLISTTLPYDSYPYLREGMRVRIIRGPLEGVEGILVHKNKKQRVVI